MPLVTFSILRDRKIAQPDPFMSTAIRNCPKYAERSGTFRCFGQSKTVKTKSQQNKRCDYQVTTMKDEANRQIKRIAIVATFFIVASLTSATAQRPIPAPRPQPQDFSAEVFEGPTPFIRFVQTKVDDIGGFSFAQFLIFPKPGRPHVRSRSDMGGLIWKREVISTPKRANSPSRSSGCMLAAQTASQLTFASPADFTPSKDCACSSRRLPMMEALTPIQPSSSRGYQAPL